MWSRLLVKWRLSGHSLVGEITEVPPAYRFLGTRLEATLWSLLSAFWAGLFALPMLMMGGSDVVLYIGGLSVLCFGCRHLYRQFRFDQELKKITKE